MMKDTIRRIRNLQRGINPEEAHIIELIDAGRFYDELTDEEKFLYNAYHGYDAGFEALNKAYAELSGIDPSEVRTRLRRKPTPEENEKIRKEIEEAVAKYAEEYNSPKEVEKRKAQYEEIQRIGALRRMDFMCGRDMDKCHPLPWQ